jgi:hypothetical protein
VGKPLEPKQNPGRGFLPFGTKLTIVTLFPGDSVTVSRPLSADFAFDKGGEYAVLAAFGGCGSEWVVAKPLKLIVATGTARTGTDIGARVPGAAPAEAATAAGPAEDWNSLLKVAGQEVDGLTLEGVLSPYSANAAHLVTSVTRVSKSRFEDSREIPSINMGSVPSNYRVLVRDSAGHPVPMTSFGAEFFSHRYEENPRYVELGSSIGTWLPLDELYGLRSDEEYTILVTIWNQAGSRIGPVSPPIRIRVPQLAVPGVTRPLFGSDVLWKKLAARASIRDAVVGVECKIAHSDQPLMPDGDPQISLWNRSGGVFGRELATAQATVLVRDTAGKPVFPIRVEGPRAKIDGSDATPFEVAWEPSTTAKRYMVEAYPLFGCEFPINLGRLSPYPIIPGMPYTILAAVRLGGEHSSFVVAEPLTFVPKTGSDFRKVASGDDSRAEAGTTSVPARDATLDWDLLNRFAGRPFDDLVMNASEDKPGELKLSLLNKGIRPIVVKKWDGAAGYDVQVRNAASRLVALTEMGKRRFGGGSFLKSHELRPNDKIEVNLPISDLFDMKGEGEYTILASLPVVGDVDAVLTAAPVKMRIGVKPATRMK